MRTGGLMNSFAVSISWERRSRALQEYSRLRIALKSSMDSVARNQEVFPFRLCLPQFWYRRSRLKRSQILNASFLFSRGLNPNDSPLVARSPHSVFDVVRTGVRSA